MVDALRHDPAISIDTEFARSHTYYPEVGLVQVYNGRDCYLIDPLAMDTLAPLADLLTDTGILKVFHACGEDMEVFQYAVEAVPAPVFDTQIATAALGVSFSISYQNLVEHYLGISIPKEETRSDWLQRPLSDAQLEYAALDVIHLLQVYERQQVALTQAGKLHWVEEECAELGKDISITLPPDVFYTRIKSSSRMKPAELNRLQVLCAWRERLARKLNVPRNRVIDEKTLVSVVRADPREKAALQAEAGMTPRQVRKYGDEVLFLLSEARLVPEHDFPTPQEDTSTSGRNEQLKRLRKVVETRAEQLNVAPELLAKRRHLEELVRSEDGGNYELPDPFTGWRRDAIGEHLLAALDQDNG